MELVKDPTLKALLCAKERKGITFEQLGKELGHNEMWVAALFYGQAQVPLSSSCHHSH
jgi:cyanate lyase